MIKRRAISYNPQVPPDFPPPFSWVSARDDGALESSWEVFSSGFPTLGKGEQELGKCCMMECREGFEGHGRPKDVDWVWRRVFAVSVKWFS